MRIQVIGRVRPQIDRERQLGEEIVTYISGSVPISVVASNNSKRQNAQNTDISIQARNTMAPKLYRLDGVLDGNKFTSRKYLLLILCFCGRYNYMFKQRIQHKQKYSIRPYRS